MGPVGGCCGHVATGGCGPSPEHIVCAAMRPTTWGRSLGAGLSATGVGLSWAPGTAELVDTWVARGTRRQRRFLAAALLSVAVVQLVLYLTVLDAGFVRDDYCWLEVAARSSDTPAVVFSRFISGFFRPAVHVVFAANYAMAGLQPWTYGLTNILIELVVTLGVGLFAYRMTRQAPAAAVGALTFATHPSHGEVVGWISARTSSLLALFALLMLVCWDRWRGTGRRCWWVGSLAAFSLALLTKEEAPVLLPALLLMDILLMRGPDRGEEVNVRLVRSSGRAFGPFAVVLAAYLFLQHGYQAENPLLSGGLYAWDAAGFVRCLDRLPGLFIWKGIARAPWLHLMFVVEAVLAVVVLYHASSSLRRLALFATGFSLLALLPSSFFVSLQAARYVYVATLGSSLAWAAVVAAVAERARCSATVRAGVAVLILATVIGQTHHLGRKVASWREERQQGNAILIATQRVTPLLREAAVLERPVCILDAPMDLPHVRSLLWLTGGVDPSCVCAGSSSSHMPCACFRRTVTLRWDANSRALLLIGKGEGADSASGARE